MIIGYVKVEDGAVITHKDSYLLENISTVSVRRPYLAGAVLMCGALIGFAVSFSDLLYEKELMVIGGISFLLFLIGLLTASLTLLSRDLKNSELSTAVWGTQARL